MKFYKKILLLLISTFFITSCNFLDVVPDEIPNDKDAFEDTNAALRYLYSCYGYLPDPRAGASSLDFMTGDEVATAFEHETFARFPKGTYTASAPVISYWDSFFQGLKQCYIMLNNVGNVSGLSETVKRDYIAQTKFLIAYYHFLLIRCYGSVILIKEEPDITTPPSRFLGRTPLDECVKYVCDLFDEAAKDLPPTRTGLDYGFATSVAAKSLKAKLLVYAASPLLNSNKYADVVDPQGQKLFPQAADHAKWEKAKIALSEALDLAKSSGYGLYENTTYGDNVEPKDPIQHKLRHVIIEPANKEIIWADTRDEGIYGLQNKTVPGQKYQNDPAYCGVAPTWAMLERFYTKNGLPIDQDPEFNMSENLSLVAITDSTIGEIGARTIKFNINREPRYYSWVAFQGGFFEVLSASSNGTFATDASYKKYSKSDNQGKLVCNFVLGGNCSKGDPSALRTNNFSPTGFLNKKGVGPSYTASKGGFEGYPKYPWPVIRLADLYLLYAEACVETNDLAAAKIYLDKVRVRAGIPTVDAAWAKVPGAVLDQAKMRDIVRQERMIELYLENQNFWDMRRWLLAEKYFNKKVSGLNISAKTLQEYATLSVYTPAERSFGTHQYLLPIPQSDINKNDKLVQNPGY